MELQEAGAGAGRACICFAQRDFSRVNLINVKAEYFEREFLFHHLNDHIE
jgi:hypothetical protein